MHAEKKKTQKNKKQLMQLMKFSPYAEKVAGKELVVTDGVSRSPVQNPESDTDNDVQAYVDAVQSTIPATDGQLHRSGRLPPWMTMDGWPKYIRDVPTGL